MSINSATTLAVTDITFDNSAGDTGSTSTAGHNTDAFDVGSSTGVTISGANVKNQDDCLAINSGTVSGFPLFEFYRFSWAHALTPFRTSPSQEELVLEAMDSLSDLSVDVLTTW